MGPGFHLGRESLRRGGERRMIGRRWRIVFGGGRGRVGLRRMLLLILLCVRTKAEWGYVEVQKQKSATAAAVSAQSTPVSFGVPNAVYPESPT